MHQHDIFWLDISMQNLMPVHKVDRLQKVTDYVAGTLLGQRLPAGDDIVELSIAAQLHNGIEILLIAEETVVLNDVGMVQEALDLQLTDELHQ